MTMRATVERDSGGAADPDNNPADPVWASHLTAMPCWLWVGGELEVMDARKVGVVSAIKMIVPRGTDITEKDRVTAVVDRRGTSMYPGVLTIAAVISRRTHLELELQAVA